MKRLDRREIEELRLKIARNCNIPASSILMHENGRFELYNVSDSDASRITSILIRDPEVINITKSASGYDFGHYDFKSPNFGMPKQKFTITGNVQLEEAMKVIKENLDEGKFLDTAKAVGNKIKNKALKWADYLINGSEEEKAYWAKVEQEIADYKADEKKSDLFYDLDFDIEVALIQGFVERYNGYQVWEDIGKEFGDRAIDFALQMVDYGLLHIMPSMEARSYMNPNK